MNIKFDIRESPIFNFQEKKPLKLMSTWTTYWSADRYVGLLTKYKVIKYITCDCLAPQDDIKRAGE